MRYIEFVRRGHTEFCTQLNPQSVSRHRDVAHHDAHELVQFTRDSSVRGEVMRNGLRQQYESLAKDGFDIT